MTNKYDGHPDQRWGHISYAQHGDDFMLINLFELLGVVKPSYLDLGAHHPFIISNTALLYARGSRGVNVEANPDLIKEFEKHRPEDKNICVGVGPTAGVFTFYKYSDTSGRNTFSRSETKTLEGVLTVKNTIELPVVTIDGIVERHCDGRYPDLLCTDLEGWDYEVLHSADFSRSKPKVIVAEVRHNDALSITMLLNMRGFFTYCRMGENIFYIDKEYINRVYP